MCPGVDLASKNESIPGGKDGRCVRVTTLLTSVECRVSRNSGALTYQKPQKATRPVVGLLYLYHILHVSRIRVKRDMIENI
jgi:hypothetical protein